MYKYQICYNLRHPYEFDFLASSDSEAKEKFQMWKRANGRWFNNISLNSYIVFSNHILTREIG